MVVLYLNENNFTIVSSVIVLNFEYNIERYSLVLDNIFLNLFIDLNKKIKLVLVICIFLIP